MRVKISLLVLGSLTTSGVTSMALSDQAAVWTMWGNCDCSFFFFLMIRPPPTPTLFPYPPLFRSFQEVSYTDAAGKSFPGYLFRPCDHSCKNVPAGLSTREPPYPGVVIMHGGAASQEMYFWAAEGLDRKSTRLNSSHSQISDSLFC